MSNVDSGEIVGDSSRQATGTIRGIVNQLWHSVHAWLDLAPDDLLFLEGAEDFDVVHPNEAIVTQVKATAANITLRSPNVIEGIKNYWEVMQKNPNRNVRYRLISTSAIGVEKGNPFGAKVAGLELWNYSHRDNRVIEQLRAFFLREECFTGDLVSFIETASTAELSAKLFSRISWDTAQADTSAVEEAVRRKLICHGDRTAISPSHSEKVASRLFSDVARLACAKEPRRLDRAEFLQIFEDATRISVPFAQHQAGSQALAQLFSQSLAASQISLDIVTLVQNGAPPLPPIIASRSGLKDEIKQRLTETGLLVLQGSTGMGKTTLATIAIGGEQTFVWANLRGLKGKEVAFVLRKLSHSLDADASQKTLVLDDLDLSPEQARDYGQVFCGLAYTMLSRGGQVLITSLKTFPQNLLRYLDLRGDPILALPRLDDSEIEEFAAKLGAPPDLAALWSKTIGFQTEGHPQLVHARLLTLARASWPAINEKEILQIPADISQERSQTRMLLAQV